ncbi:RagB/SusD family nutrient uptake outer membrane protein [Pontibacter sp. 13R65]|uniref:RagB/SusD family nutrient uptake outer membrane protein n=1 Tax=Pontibacter sp. 13R65 TaxID=3127458 RepID=UPI00301CCB9C
MKILNKIKSKTIKVTTLAAVLLFTATACKDELETKVYSQLSPDNFFTSEADFNGAVVTLYSVLTTAWGNPDPGANTWYSSFYSPDQTSYFLRGMLSTDIMESDGEPNLRNFTWGPATWQGSPETTYSKIRYVARATDAIDKMTKSTSVSETIKSNYIAEAKVMRAWIMYNIYDFFGPVNVKLDPATLTDNAITPRLSEEAYTGQIEKDLMEAIATPGFAEMHNSNVQNWGRVSKGVARMLLLKLYMHTKQWSKAEAIGKEIINMEYRLLDNYANVFNEKANPEIIYAVPTNAAQASFWVTEVLPSDFASTTDGSITRSTGWYLYWMPWSFYDKYFLPTDLRRTTTMLESYINTSGQTVGRSGLRGAIPLKYTDVQGPGPGHSQDLVVFRLGEVYLSVAEAINELRGPAEAYEFVNPIRRRAGVSEFSGLSQEAFRQTILDERGRELYAEGVRRQDLIRHGQFISNAIARGKTNAQPHMVRFAIPSNVMIEGKGIIEQNPGY